MEILKWLVCLFWVCEQSPESPATTPAVSERNDFEVSRTRLPDSAEGCDLNGYWYNELGSETFLKVSLDGLIRGEYRTGVEFSRGGAGEGPSYVVGTSDEDGKRFGFSVLYNGYNTSCVTSWVGVCDVCNGQTILKTSWVLQYLEKDECAERNKWTGENTFTRREQKAGPRRAEDTHNPRDVQKRNRAAERNQEVSTPDF